MNVEILKQLSKSNNSKVKKHPLLYLLFYSKVDFHGFVDGRYIIIEAIKFSLTYFQESITLLDAWADKKEKDTASHSCHVHRLRS